MNATQSRLRMIAGIGTCAAGLVAVSAGALAEYGQPENYGLGLQDAATQIAEEIRYLHDVILTPLIIIICLFVLGLLAAVLVKFNEKANPIPSRNSHNTVVEVAWTVVPIVILVLIAIPSFNLLYKQYDFPKSDVVIKATGNQWYWSYEYPDAEGVSFDANMLAEDELKEGQPRLMSVDNEIVVPVNKNVHVLITASDVIHNWTIPSFGSKVDAVPGQTTATWFNATRKGIYYGQCSELCGIRHAFMPIAVRVVDQDLYERWLAARKAGDDDKIEAVIKEAALREKKSTVAGLEN